MKKGILLVNLGTPRSPSTGDVRRYLREFLSDPDVIDINPVGRWFLVNLIIAPTRAPKSAKLYETIWTKEGSPLLTHSLALRDKLRTFMGNEVVIELAMRYQEPSLRAAMEALEKAGVDEITALPLYPQFAESSTGSTIKAIERYAKKLKRNIPVRIIDSFYNHPAYLEALAKVAAAYDHRDYDHVLFSYHGLPERHIHKASEKYNMQCSLGACCESGSAIHHCYRAHCVQTTRQLATRLGIPKEKYTMCFQSRLGRDPWIKPYSDEVIAELGKKGVKKILAFSPAFVADCLETIHEIGVEYLELFREHGGESLQLVPALNSNDVWVKAVAEILK